MLNIIDAEIDDLNHVIVEQKETMSKYNPIEERWNAVSRILGKKPEENKYFDAFLKLAEEDFFKFCNSEGSLAEEASAVKDMDRLVESLRLIKHFPLIFNKNIIAVGGGFSAGKSSLLNCFIQKDNANKIFLPVGINPVTAIPTYIISSNDANAVVGCNYHGAELNLDTEFYKKLNHDFLNSLEFNLKEILPCIALKTIFPNNSYKNICFIDTPGYNPSSKGEDFNSDIESAKKFLSKSSAMIWMIGLDSTGTFPKTDLDFLDQLDIQNKSFYVILNKAQLKSNEDREDILDEVNDILNDEGIIYEGISAYNTNLGQELSFRGNSLYSFLEKHNIKLEHKKELKKQMDSIFKRYEDAIIAEIQFLKNNKSIIKNIRFDIIENGYDDLLDSKMGERLQEITNSLSHERLELNLTNLHALHKIMESALNDFFNNL